MRKYYQTIERTIIHCDECGENPLYLSEVSDPASPRFDESCCPYCGSTSVYEHTEDVQILDFGAVLERITALKESLGWDRGKQKAHLIQHYNKCALSVLEEQQLLSFLEYLESQK